MRRIILVLLVMMASVAAQAQYAGYTPLTDLQKFKTQFTATALKTSTIKSDFTQEKNLDMLAEKIVSKGKFWFKKNNMVRMEYEHPYKYLMIINNDNVFIKDEQKENKISTKSNKLFQQINKIMLDCVQGTVLSNPDFKTRVFEGKGTYLIEMTPVSKLIKGLFKTINITIDKKDNSVASINMQEVSGDNTLIHFTNKEINTAIPDALFSIK